MSRTRTIWIPLPDQDRFSEEQLRLCALDLVINRHYNDYALFFRTKHEDEGPAIIRAFRQALSATLGQCRHIAGTIQKNEHGDFSIITRSDSTVPLVLAWLDTNDQISSFDLLEDGSFHGASLGDPSRFTVPTMSMSSNASPSIQPHVAGFQLTFIRGGFIMTTCIHHFAMDVVGASSLIHHIAAHCHSVLHGTTPPTWHKSLVDRSRFIPRSLPDTMQERYPSAPANLEWKPCVSLLFSISRIKLAELKRLALPPTSAGTWISTYDAICALLWRIVLRHRMKIYRTDPASTAIFAESINMRQRVQPAMDKRYQGNLQCGALSTQQPHQYTVEQVTSKAPLHELAAYIRKITNSATESAVEATISRVSAVRDRSNLYFRQDTMPPTSLVVTDWRDVDMANADFGFGRPVAVRQLADKVVRNLVIIYPRRPWGKNGQDHGLEVVVPFEKHAVDILVDDPEMSRFFAFRGIDAQET
ncbi:transferase [Coniella lustricola]|uniref:Transferase n=1 Tax=Coniella lustricola TaxID=2025994 RepID=A0A2T3A095_9PEZI|nr:transferase [Coniella lustricola]